MTIQPLNQPLEKPLLEAVCETREELPDELRELAIGTEQEVRWVSECLCMNDG